MASAGESKKSGPCKESKCHWESPRGGVNEKLLTLSSYRPTCKHLVVSLGHCWSSESVVGKKIWMQTGECEDKLEHCGHIYICPSLYLITKQPSESKGLLPSKLTQLPLLANSTLALYGEGNSWECSFQMN